MARLVFVRSIGDSEEVQRGVHRVGGGALRVRARRRRRVRGRWERRARLGTTRREAHTSDAHGAGGTCAFWLFPEGCGRGRSDLHGRRPRGEGREENREHREHDLPSSAARASPRASPPPHPSRPREAAEEGTERASAPRGGGGGYRTGFGAKRRRRRVQNGLRRLAGEALQAAAAGRAWSGTGSVHRRTSSSQSDTCRGPRPPRARQRRRSERFDTVISKGSRIGI